MTEVQIIENSDGPPLLSVDVLEAVGSTMNFVNHKWSCPAKDGASLFWTNLNVLAKQHATTSRTVSVAHTTVIPAGHVGNVPINLSRKNLSDEQDYSFIPELSDLKLGKLGGVVPMDGTGRRGCGTGPQCQHHAIYRDEAHQAW